MLHRHLETSNETVDVNNFTTKILLRVIRMLLYGSDGVEPVLALCNEAAQKVSLCNVKEFLCLQWTSENITLQERQCG